MMLAQKTLMLLVHRRDFAGVWKLFADRNNVPLQVAAIVKKFEGFSQWQLRMRVSGAGPAEREIRWAVALYWLIGARSHSQIAKSAGLGMMLEAGDTMTIGDMFRPAA